MNFLKRILKSSTILPYMGKRYAFGNLVCLKSSNLNETKVKILQILSASPREIPFSATHFPWLISPEERIYTFIFMVVGRMSIIGDSDLLISIRIHLKSHRQ